MNDCADCAVNRTELVSGNIFIRPVILGHAGDTLDGHEHAFDHTTFVMRGSVQVIARAPDGGVASAVFSSPSHFLVKKDTRHEITALEDETIFYCVYAHRNPQGEIVQESTGWEEAYAHRPWPGAR